MAEGQRVVLEAVFKSSGLDRMGRQFDLVSEKMRRMGSAMKSWGAGGGADFGKQFQVGAQMEMSQDKLARAGKVYKDLLGQIDKTNDPAKRSQLERHLGAVQRIGEAEMRIQDKLGRGAAETGAKMVSMAWLRRGLRIGAGAMGLPLSMAAIGRQMGEAGEQEKMIGHMALRIREVNGPIKDFSEYTMDLRRNIVAAGAEFAFSGRESLALTDSLSKMAGGMVDMRTVFEGARGLGIAPQAAGQALALSRRLGGRDAQNPAADEKLMHNLGKAITSSGMLPRGEEFAQTLSQAMQTYSSRLPAVNPDTLMGIFAALSNDRTSNSVGRLAPTLRGQGGLQVTQGLTSMMDDMSESMVAIQSEIIGRDPGAFKKTAAQLGLTEGESSAGGGRYAMLNALKQAGIADPDGLKLAGRTIKEVTVGLDKGTRIAVESQLLRVSPQIIAALEKGGFMKQLMDEKIGFDDFKKTVDRLSGNAAIAMETPGQQWAHLGREVGAHIVDTAEKGLGGVTKATRPGVIAEMLGEGTSAWAVPGLMLGSAGERMTKGGNGNKIAGGALGALGTVAMYGGLASAGPMGWLGLAGLMAGGTALGAGVLSKPLGWMGGAADMAAEGAGRFSAAPAKNTLDIVITIAGSMNPLIAGMIAAERLGKEIMKHAHLTGNNVKVQGPQSPNSDRGGH